MACIMSWIVLAGIWRIASSTPQCVVVWILGWFIMSNVATIRNFDRLFAPWTRGTPWCLLCNEYIPCTAYFAKCSICDSMYHDTCCTWESAQRPYGITNCMVCNRPTVVFQHINPFSHHHLFDMILVWVVGCVLPVAGIYIVPYFAMTWWTNPDHLQSMETCLDQLMEDTKQDRANHIRTQINTQINTRTNQTIQVHQVNE